jgi:hypothetical protein
MKVILNKTLKGSETWMKGEVFDDSKKPLPSDISALVDVLRAKDQKSSDLITILSDPKPAPVSEPSVEEDKGNDAFLSEEQPEDDSEKEKEVIVEEKETKKAPVLKKKG